jgi:predicted Zn-dependent protease
MTTDDAAKKPIAGSLASYESLYNRHRFLDLYEATSPYWSPSTDLASLPLEALLLGGRLAAHVGGPRLSRHLFRAAYQRDPSDPRVRYFTRDLNPGRRHLLDDLKAFLDHPDIGGDDLPVRGFWYAVNALTWAELRDFDRAHECLRTAHALIPEDSWVLTCESGVHGLADRWADALKAAERALEVDPGAPYAVNGLGTALINLGRVEEASTRLLREAEAGQSYELILIACWHLCALAETLQGNGRRSALDKARALTGRLPALMPLADRESLRSVARMNLDIAALSDDHAAIERWSAEACSSFHRQLLANLKKNAAGSRLRLPFRRTIQKYATCVPSSLAAAMSANGIAISAQEMASDITYGGTQEWAAADWLRSRGYHVRFFPVTPRLATDLIRNEIAFVISWDAEEGGHAVAVIGVDERAQTLLVHDPNWFRSSEYLFQALDPSASPLGIKGMAVVTQEQAARLDSLLPPESAIMEAAQEFDKQMRLHGASASRQVVCDLVRQYPSHPGARYLAAAQDLEDGQIGRALLTLKELLGPFSASSLVRFRFLAACRALGNTAQLLETLKNIVEAGFLPGLEARQDWIYPPGWYICRYADLLALSASTRPRAERLLMKIVERQRNSAGAWHSLADLLLAEGDRPGALLSFRISSCLAENNEHYARAYADALASERLEEEGFQWLETLARRYQDTSHAAGPWISWISLLEDRGYPERALAACQEALTVHGASAEALAFAVPFFARMGDWTRAEAELGRLREAGLPHGFFEASARYSLMRGDLESAGRNAEAWLAELPGSFEARDFLLNVHRMRWGNAAALRTARQWMQENKDHEGFEETYCAELNRAEEPRGKAFSVLFRRLKRNPEDAWAWRELAFDAMFQYDAAGERERERLAPRIARFLAECDRTSGGSMPTVRAHALWARCRGDWTAAVAESVDSIALDPGAFYSYRQAWECSARLKAGEREDLWKRIEPLFLSSTNRLSISGEVAGLLGDRFGVAAAEERTAVWLAGRPDDPDLLNAAAVLLVEHGHGRSDAARAIEMLEPAVRRYPYHAELRFSLARAYRGAGREAEAEGVLAEIIRRHPDHAAAKIQLAWIMHRKGNTSGALSILEAAIAAAPQNAYLVDALARLLIETGRHAEAVRTIDDGLGRLARDVQWRERAIELYRECGAEDKAVRAAREGTVARPRDAYTWCLLGQTLLHIREHADVGELELCLRRSLELHSGLFHAADLLAVLLAEQRRYDDAAKILRGIQERLAEPSPALGRQAWILRQRGEKKAAIAAMGDVLADFPWYGWGWSVLMGWLEEDSDRGETLRLLQAIPPPMLTDPSFRWKRLVLLESAQSEVEQLDREWDSLLRDFPEDPSLHAIRYDSLTKTGRWRDAAAVLTAIESVVPEDPFILARRCEALAHDKDYSGALEVALRICFLPVEEGPWPAGRTWEIARGTFGEDLARRFRERLRAGDRPTPAGFSGLTDYLMRYAAKRLALPILTTWFPGRGARELKRLVGEVSSAPWDGSRYRALAYRLLGDYGYHRLVIRLSAKRDPAAVTSIDEWAEIGRSLAGSHMSAAARRHYADWRERSGVEMWMVCNYVLSLARSRRDHLLERYASSRDALAALPHDHCAKYLAHAQAEACAVLGFRERFLETWTTCARYFDGQVGGQEYFPREQRYLLKSLPELAGHLTNGRTWRARVLAVRLWYRRFELSAAKWLLIVIAGSVVWALLYRLFH